MKKGKNYFDEQYMLEKLNNYTISKKDDDLSDISVKCIDIIHGMINKEFSYNTIILKDRESFVQDCMYEIIKYIKKGYYKPEKGRLFAYINRIIKNTLLRKYYYNKKIMECETSIYCDEFENEELMDFISNKYEDMFKIVDNTIKINKNDSIIYIYYINKEILNNIDNINNGDISLFIKKLKYNNKYEISSLNIDYIKYLLLNIKDVIKDINVDIEKKYDISKEINIYSNYKLPYYPFSYIKKLKMNTKYKNFINENNKNDIINIILFLGYYNG